MARREEGREHSEGTDNLRDFFWNSPIGMARLTKDMDFIEVNPYFEDILGLRSEDLQGRNFYDFAEQYRKPGVGEVPPGLMMVGNAVMEVWSTPLRDEMGEITGYSLIAKSVTKERRREEMGDRYIASLENELEAKNREFYEGINKAVYERTEALRERVDFLEKANGIKDILIEVLSHDLLNPVGIAKNYAELLSERETDEEKLEELDAIQRNLDKIVEIVEDSNKYAKLESAEQLFLERRDIGEMFKRVVEKVRPSLDKKKIKLRFRPWRRYPSMVDESIADVFENLLSNAIKYSPEGGRIVVDIIDNGGNWKIMVKDYGEGIPNDHKKSIFQRFERKTKDGVKGSGFGLAIVKRAVELHKGRVWVEDNPDGGSIFYVSLPKVSS
jgi:signal transduction histidine kinase